MASLTERNGKQEACCITIATVGHTNLRTTVTTCIHGQEEQADATVEMAGL